MRRTFRLLVVSHPCALPVNQQVYAELTKYGWDIHLVVPSRWRHEYWPGSFTSEFLPSLAELGRRLPVLGVGLPQRHVYGVLPGRVVDSVEPHAAFLEQEPFALVTAQWLGALRRRRIPIAVQHAENMDRPYPAVARAIRSIALARVALVAARSPRAAALATRYRRGVRTAVIPHAVPGWGTRPARSNNRFTIGYAGRLTEIKGLADLVEASGRLEMPAQLLIVGDGPMRASLAAASTEARPIEVRTGVPHDEMGAAFEEMDVLVLPSRTTSTWSEQFGRVLVEAMWCHRPVVAADSGEIPWVLSATGGGILFREGDTAQLTDALTRLATDPDLWTELATRGRRAVETTFSLEAVAQQMDRELRQIVPLRSAA